MTFEQKSLSSNHRSVGFDYLRIWLSIFVPIVHCLQISNYTSFRVLWGSSFGPLISVILPSFFALSGYLVSGSLIRNSIPNFITLRIIRIFPALVVEIFLTAFIVGSIFTTMPLNEYFTNPIFFQYFQNSIGLIHYPLPGVFGGAAANMQLWTVPFEFECYFSLVIMASFGMHRYPRAFLGFTALLYVVFAAYFASRSIALGGQNVSGKVLVLCFLFGCSGFLMKEMITHSFGIFVFSLAISYVTLFYPEFSPLCAPAVAYATIYIGLLNPPRLPFGDLSYGVFLFHSPVARSIYEISGQTLSPFLLTALTLPFTGLFAMLSWRLVEAPILKAKKPILSTVAKATEILIRFFEQLRFGKAKASDT